MVGLTDDAEELVDILAQIYGIKTELASCCVIICRQVTSLATFSETMVTHI